jgi:hypothetical protein
MSSSTPTNTSKLDRILADNQRDKEMGYRDKALKMYPHVCGRCAREFSGKRLSELTVHHRDHNHDNNPQDGSNWELLCAYLLGIWNATQSSWASHPHMPNFYDIRKTALL